MCVIRQANAAEVGIPVDDPAAWRHAAGRRDGRSMMPHHNGQPMGHRRLSAPPAIKVIRTGISENPMTTKTPPLPLSPHGRTIHARPGEHAFCIGVMAALLCSALVPARSARGEELVIVQDAGTDHHIVVAVEATIQDYHAAQLLQRYVKQITDVEVPIISDDNAPGEAEIVIGFNRHTRELAPDLKRQAFGPEAFLIRTVDRHLLIVGGAPRGVLYGVNSLLTDEWGCRWFTPRHAMVPRRQRLALGPVRRNYRPPFTWRNVEYLGSRDVDWTFHNFLHQEVHRHGQSGWPEKGWRRTGPAMRCFVHTMPGLLPAGELRPDHPDYFWPREGGPPRSGPPSQGRRVGACVTHPEVAQLTARAVMQRRAGHPEGDVWYILSAGDYNDWCECERCRQWLRREAGGTLPAPHPQWGAGANWPYGSMWLDFAARVSGILSAHPQPPRVGMVAYGYTPVPPTNPTMHPDLCVIYAPHDQQTFRPLRDPRQVVPVRLAGWLRSAGTVYQWLYTMNYGSSWWFIHPVDGFIADDLRYLRRMGVKGVFAEGNAGVSGTHAGDMSELHAYLFARLMWDPDLDWRRERRAFCAAYYGPEAGAVIEAYLDDRHAAVVKSDQGGRVGMEREHFEWVTPTMIARWYALLDRAEALADNDEHRKQVRVARLAVQFTEASLLKDPDQRKEALQAYVRAVRGLIGNPAMNLREHHHTWAAREGLTW